MSETQLRAELLPKKLEATSWIEDSDLSVFSVLWGPGPPPYQPPRWGFCISMARWSWHLPVFTATILRACTLCSSLPFKREHRAAGTGLCQFYCSDCWAKRTGNHYSQGISKEDHFNIKLHQSPWKKTYISIDVICSWVIPALVLKS